MLKRELIIIMICRLQLKYVMNMHRMIFCELSLKNHDLLKDRIKEKEIDVYIVDVVTIYDDQDEISKNNNNWD